MYKVVVSQFESYIFDRSSILFYNRVMNKPKRPRDPNQLAKLIVDIATGEAIPPENEPSKKILLLLHLVGWGGVKGGKARAEKLTPEQRSNIAKKAAKKRWQHKK